MHSVLALVDVLSFDSQPILSWPGTSSFGQVFNPAWVGGPKPGLLLRTQNCTARVGDCVRCSGNGSAASVLTFSAQQHNWKGGPPTYAPITRSSVVFGPHDATDDLGTEDPRVTYDASSGTHYIFYTCYNSGSTPQPHVTLCLATTADPSSAIGWARHRTLHARCMRTYAACTLHGHCMDTACTLRARCVHTACTLHAQVRHGPVGLPANSKSGALLLRPSTATDPEPEHMLFWGAGTIHLSRSRNLSHWPVGVHFVTIP